MLSGGKEDDDPSTRSLTVAKKVMVNMTTGKSGSTRMAKGRITKLTAAKSD